MIEGGTSKNFLHTKQMIFQRPDLYASLMKKVTSMTTEYLKAQVRAGAQAVQIFDTWAGILSPQDFVDHALKYVQEIISKFKLRNQLETLREAELTYLLIEKFASREINLSNSLY